MTSNKTRRKARAALNPGPYYLIVGGDPLRQDIGRGHRTPYDAAKAAAAWGKPGELIEALIHWFARLVIEAPQPLTPEQWAPLVELDRNLVVALAHLAIKAKKIKATPAGALVAVPEKKGKK